MDLMNPMVLWERGQISHVLDTNLSATSDSGYQMIEA